MTETPSCLKGDFRGGHGKIEGAGMSFGITFLHLLNFPEGARNYISR